MVKPIVITSDDLIQTENFNTYVYTFPAPVTFYEGDSLALAGLACYLCWFNITAAFNNNKFTYYWFDSTHDYASGGVQYDVTIPDGWYSIETLNEYLQFVMINNSTYLVDSSNYVYYLEFVYNTTYNRLQLVSYALPTALPAGYSYPTGATWLLPAAATCPVLEVLSDNSFSDIIGFDAGLYPSTYQSSDWTTLGQNESAFHAGQSSMLVTCNLVRNTFALPSTLLAAVSIIGKDFGDIIDFTPGTYAYVPIQAGQQTDLIISLYDQDFTPLKLERQVLTIYLLYKRKDDII